MNDKGAKRGRVIVIEGKGCRTILTPSKPVKYKI